MRLQRLVIKNFRNIEQSEIAPAHGLNVVVGANGSGKTSLLEALHVLSVGRSFLSRQSEIVVRHGMGAAELFALTLDEKGNQRRIGVRRSKKGELEVRIDGMEAERAELARQMPSILMTPDSHRVVQGGPAERRALLDWGLFHVEHGFLDVWRAYQRNLKQRNATLGAGEADATIRAWDVPLAELGEQIAAARQSYMDHLQMELTPALQRIGASFGNVTLRLEKGWPGTKRLLEAMNDSFARDRRYQATSVGPHRADLRFVVDGRDASDILSRGQEKLLVIGLRLAQLALLRQKCAQVALVFIDDLPAELDADRRAALYTALIGLDAQIFVTATELDPAAAGAAVFHVEQGRFALMV